MRRSGNNKDRIILFCLLYAHRSLLIALCFLLFALCSLLYALSLEARVTGNCSNCHTMHNSQGGSNMQIGYNPTSGAKANLLRANGCIGCHATTDSGSTGVGGAPIVYNTTGVNYGDSQPDGKHIGLAAGNFFWTTETSASGQSRGHSIAGISNDDTSTPSNQRTACGTKECHTALSDKGCESCHLPAHHKYGNSTPGIADSEDGYYRFLGPLTSASSDHKWGVRGYEDPDWQEGTGSSNHNEYSGEDQQAGGGYQSISKHCGCHYPTWPGTCQNFPVHWTTLPFPPYPVVPDKYHQAAKVLPPPGSTWTGYNPGGVGVPPSPYSPLLPIARKNITSYTSPSATVTHNSNDTLTCLTCHRAHASPYDKMLRWDNSAAWDALPNASCKGCHSADPIP